MGKWWHKNKNMGAAVFFSLGLLILLSVPIITSRLGKRMGRDPKVWFVIGIVLPVISTVILCCLPDKSEEVK